jgi:hypothetical protein
MDEIVHTHTHIYRVPPLNELAVAAGGGCNAVARERMCEIEGASRRPQHLEACASCLLPCKCKGGCDLLPSCAAPGAHYHAAERGREWGREKLCGWLAWEWLCMRAPLGRVAYAVTCMSALAVGLDAGATICPCCLAVWHMYGQC